jgi:hypothetical protein
MAIAVSTGTTKGRANDTLGARRVTRLRVTLDTSYPTGGYAFDPKQFGHVGAVSIVRVDPRSAGGATGTCGKTFTYDYTAKKIVGWCSDTKSEVANAGDVSAVVLDIEVISD